MIYFGADYYPEHWPEERWERDAQLMQAAGINVVRIGEFAWSKLEPEEGKYDFGWLDRIIALLAKYNVKSILGTPTPTPPAWLTEKYPEVLWVNNQGRRTIHGSRRHVCLSNSTYREYSKNIVTELATRYGDNNAVIGWQVDNEFGCHSTTRCYCASCRASWQAWLRRRYETLAKLNEAWGTVFWSESYTAWEQIPVPLKITPAPHNPSMRLDYARFSSDLNVDYQRLQIDILRELTSGQFITHNFMGLFGEIDYYDLAEDLDFVSWDNYPRFQDQYNPVRIALSHDATRSFKKQNFWVMEEQVGPTGSDLIASSLYSGEMRLWTHQAVAHGADGILYYRWRTCRFGQEEFWQGILDHDGIPRRRYEEIKKIGEELNKLAPYLEATQPMAKVGMFYSFDNRWAFDVQPHTKALDYMGHLESYYQFFYDNNIPVDILKPGQDLTGYQVIVAPTLFLLTEEMAKQLEQFVQAGGTLITTYRSGVKDWANVVVNTALPGLLSELVGAEVYEYSSLPAGVEVDIVGSGLELNQKGQGRAWVDALKPYTAAVWAHCASGPLAGMPVVTHNKYGDGQVLYIGTWLNEFMLNSFLAKVVPVQSLTVDEQLSASAGIELASRVDTKTNRKVVFALNSNSQAGKVAITKDWELLVGQVDEADNSVIVPAYGVIVLVKA